MDTVRSFLGTKNLPGLTWQGVKGKLNFTRDDLRGALLELEQPVWVVEDQGKISLAVGGQACPAREGLKVLGLAPARQGETACAARARSPVPAAPWPCPPGQAGAGSHGVAGVTQSGIEAAKAVLNCRTRDLLNKNGPSLTFLPSEDVSQWPEYLRRKVNSRLPSPRAMLAGKENPSSGWDEGRRDAMFGFCSGPYLPGPRSTRGLATLTLISFPARE